MTRRFHRTLSGPRTNASDGRVTLPSITKYLGLGMVGAGGRGLTSASGGFSLGTAFRNSRLHTVRLRRRAAEQ